MLLMEHVNKLTLNRRAKKKHLWTRVRSEAQDQPAPAELSDLKLHCLLIFKKEYH